jgi:hypothetical protein
MLPCLIVSSVPRGEQRRIEETGTSRAGVASRGPWLTLELQRSRNLRPERIVIAIGGDEGLARERGYQLLALKSWSQLQVMYM